MNTKKQIQSDNRVGYTDSFIGDNRGRTAKIEFYDESGKEIIASNLPLQHLVYDPPGSGDALSIALGHDKVEISHIIESPNQIIEVHNINGKVQALEVTDHKDVLNIVTS